jgi:hypothetical protein
VLVDGSALTLRPQTFGRDWFSADLLGGARPGHAVVPLAAVASVVFTGPQAAVSLTATPSELSQTSLPARLTLSFVLRDLCRRRAAVDVTTQAGLVHGTIDRVGRDHLDLAVHESGVARRESAVREFRAIPLTQLVLVVMR